MTSRDGPMSLRRAVVSQLVRVAGAWRPRDLVARAAGGALICCLATTAFSNAWAGPKGAIRSHQIDKYAAWLDSNPAAAAALIKLIIESDPDTFPQAELAASNGKLQYRLGRLHQVIIPGGALSAMLARLPSSVLVRYPYPMQAVAVTGQGVSLSGAADMQALNYKGAGVTIGVIDVGFGSLATSQSKGELPANLTVTDYTGTGTGGDTHGTNVAEIVYDMAPGATLRLAKVSTETELNQAKNDMIAAGAKVINHSVVWFNAGFYDGIGPICDIANAAGTAGVHWVNAMGNHRYKHYLGTFSDSNSDLRHEFAANQNYNTINLTAGSTIALFLNWDNYPQTTVDYDLELYNGNPDSGGTLVMYSRNKQSGKGLQWFPYPYEDLTYTPPTTGTYYIVVRKASTSTTNLRFTLFSSGPDLNTRTTTSSLVQPADCANVIGVGATDLSDNAEYFSSEGPTTDGRAKPEIDGPDRVQTSLSTLFAGTSAAAPHVSGAIATLISQNPGATAAQIKSLLTGTAKDVATAGVDYRTGSGRISLDADMDGRNHDSDNCRLVANTDQLNTDGDTEGNACDADDDNDGLSDALELAIGTNPLLVDTDGDGLSDYFEVAFDSNPAAYTPGLDLNPLSMDTDGDGLSDYAELAYDGTIGSYAAGFDPNPLARDTDGDGIADGIDALPLAFNHFDGDILSDGVVDIADFTAAQQIALGLRQATTLELTHGDLYPPGAPDGQINLSDLILLLNRIR